MKTQKLIIPGGSGYLGCLLTNHFACRGHEVVVLTRTSFRGAQTAGLPPSATLRNPDGPRCTKTRYVSWNGVTPDAWTTELDNADAVINLAGRSVNCRYNRKNKQAIYDSRLKSTAVLGHVIAACGHPPKVWINSSTATIYRHAEDREMDEITGEIGNDFSMDVAKGGRPS